MEHNITSAAAMEGAPQTSAPCASSALRCSNPSADAMDLVNQSWVGAAADHFPDKLTPKPPLPKSPLAGSLLHSSCWCWKAPPPASVTAAWEVRCCCSSTPWPCKGWAAGRPTDPNPCGWKGASCSSGSLRSLPSVAALPRWVPLGWLLTMPCSSSRCHLVCCRAG